VLRVTILELPARWDDVAGGLREVDELLANGGGTDLVVLPELALTGYVSPEAKFDLTHFAEPLDGETIREATKLAVNHGVHLVVPLVLAEDAQLYNTAVVIGPSGEIVASYRKRHPWFPERWATKGPHDPPLIEIGGVKVTLAICYDGHFLADESPAILASADLLIFTSAWVDDEDSRMPLLRGLAKTFDIAIANANWGEGGVVEVPGQGGSCILDRMTGNVIAEVKPPSRRADAVLVR